MPLQTSSRSSSSAMVLSAEDVDRLLNDTSSGTRIDMTNRIGGAYSQSSLSSKETIVAEQIFRLLLRDTELKVRVSLAEHVKDSAQIPRDIVMALVHDVEEVSLPVLQFSEVLTDEDLVELIQGTEQINRYLAISKRHKISTAITDTLLDKNIEQVTTVLVKNKGAEITEKGFSKILEVHASNEALMQSLSERSALPLSTVDKMIAVVSSSLASKLKQKYKVSDEHIDHEIERTREKETLHLVRLAVADTDIEKLINQLHSFGRLTPSIILSSLCQGNFDFFEHALARLSNIPVSNARKLINDRGELGFRGVYNKTGLPDTMFPAVKLLLKVVRELSNENEKPGTARFANRIVERILQYSEESPMENLSYILALVRKVG